MATAEELRAAAYRAQCKARAAWRKAHEPAGDPAAYRALVDKTKALLLYDEHGVPRIGVRDG